MTTDSKVIFTSLDVEDIQAHPRGQRVINGLISCKGNRLYRTARGRLAIQTQPENLAKLQTSLKFTLAEGLDGTRLVTIPDIADAALPKIIDGAPPMVQAAA